MRHHARSMRRTAAIGSVALFATACGAGLPSDPQAAVAQAFVNATEAGYDWELAFEYEPMDDAPMGMNQAGIMAAGIEVAGVVDGSNTAMTIDVLGFGSFETRTIDGTTYLQVDVPLLRAGMADMDYDLAEVLAPEISGLPQGVADEFIAIADTLVAGDWLAVTNGEAAMQAQIADGTTPEQSIEAQITEMLDEFEALGMFEGEDVTRAQAEAAALDVVDNMTVLFADPAALIDAHTTWVEVAAEDGGTRVFDVSLRARDAARTFVEALEPVIALDPSGAGGPTEDDYLEIQELVDGGRATTVGTQLTELRLDLSRMVTSIDPSVEVPGMALAFGLRNHGTPSTIDVPADVAHTLDALAFYEEHGDLTEAFTTFAENMESMGPVDGGWYADEMTVGYTCDELHDFAAEEYPAFVETVASGELTVDLLGQVWVETLDREFAAVVEPCSRTYVTSGIDTSAELAAGGDVADFARIVDGWAAASTA